MSRKHILIILACCLVPLLVLGAVTVLKVPLSQVITFGLVLLCPLSHLLLMKYMGHGEEHKEHPHAMLSEPTEKLEH